MVPFLTANEVADWLKLNVDTVYTLIRQDGLPAYKLGGQWRFREPEVREWADARRNSESASSATRTP